MKTLESLAFILGVCFLVFVITLFWRNIADKVEQKADAPNLSLMQFTPQKHKKDEDINKYFRSLVNEQALSEPIVKKYAEPQTAIQKSSPKEYGTEIDATQASIQAAWEILAKKRGKTHEQLLKELENDVIQSTAAFVSCRCTDLQTSHPGRMAHKMQCPLFWELNEGRTKKELMQFEGFK